MVMVDERVIAQILATQQEHEKRLAELANDNARLVRENADLTRRLSEMTEAYNNLLVEHHRALKENEHLHREVARLKEELRLALETCDSMRQEMVHLQAHVKELERQLFGRKSEKRPRVTPVERELSAEDKRAAYEKGKEAREERRRKQKELPEQEVRHEVPVDEQTHCDCGRSHTDWKELAQGDASYETHYIPGRFIRYKHIQQVLRCPCGAFHKAPMPARVITGGGYTPEVTAHVVALKYADSIPYYRLEQQTEREGLSLPRSTMTDLTMDAATQLEPLYTRVGQLIREMDIVQADETWHRLQKPSGKGTRGKAWMWVFLGEVEDPVTREPTGRLLYYCLRTSRSGETPVKVLGGTKGTLVVDAYSGYSKVTKPDGRVRAGCLAHARRRFYVALVQGILEAQAAVDLIREVYRVEHDAKELGIVGSPEHLALRQDRSAAAMEKLHAWLLAQQPLQGPTSTLGSAIKYALKNWEHLSQFLSDAKLPPDNNGAENALRTIALGRKNYLFYFDETTGQKQAVLYSLIASCRANGVNPELWLADVLRRIDMATDEELDDLLPHRWVASTGARP